MRDPLVIAVAQPLTLADTLESDVDRHCELIRSAAARIVVFPELSLTGYDFSAPAITPDDPRLEPLVEACAASDSIGLVGAPVTGERGSRSIGVLRVDRDGVFIAYRKMWLGEAERPEFEPGTTPGVIDVDGWRIGLAVCKDTGEPRHTADTMALGVDIYAAGVLEHATDHHVQPERARRIIGDHGVWVAIASYAGSTGEGFDHASGGSAIWNPGGDLVASCGDHPGAVAVATIR